MITVDFNYEMLLDKLANKEKFDFSRYGDGEWNAIFRDRKTNMNCDGHFYYDSLGDAMLKVLKSSPDYYIGIQNLAIRQREKQIREITEQYDLKWCNADFLHKANIKKNIQPLFDVLQSRDVILIGPRHLYQLAVKQAWYFIEIPPKNCWLKVEEIRKDINALIYHKDWVLLYAASMMTNVLVHDFRDQVTQIDIGSVLDPHAGVVSRSYHHALIQ